MKELFTKDSQAIFWNNNAKAIQRMLDYGYICERKIPSVAAIVHPTNSSSFQKFFVGTREVLVPIYKSTAEAVKHHPTASTFLNFASFRTAYEVSMEAMEFDSLKTHMITAEGIPERYTRKLRAIALKRNKLIIGPATVGGITPGSFKIANVGGTIENIIKTKLHRPGSAGVVTRSGGLFNELGNILSMNADGIAEGVAIGGDRYPCSTFLDHLLRMEKNPQVKYFVVLGEVGGHLEYDIIEAIKDKRLTKPIIAWCIGTVAAEFESDGFQFGHAGANANAEEETAGTKNKMLKEAGVLVPESFNELPALINQTFNSIVGGHIKDESSETVPEIPEDYNTAVKDGKVRKITNFVCTISDDRGEEAHYVGYPISSVATPDTGFSVADVITLLWFKQRYPKWAADFLETVIKTVADHGPAVSGAHNARVTARAGKDLISSLVTGILTIGPRFGGAIDGAAKYFKYALDNNMDPKEFVSYMKKKNMAIPGIGHRIKSIQNPDLRVTGLVNYAKTYFPSTELLDYAKKVELLTTAKKGSLILNVDGAIGVLMIDMWKNIGYSDEEIEDYVEAGALNAFFVLGRTIGFIGHALDEKRLKMPLYRHEFDDILYNVEKAEAL